MEPRSQREDKFLSSEVEGGKWKIKFGDKEKGLVVLRSDEPEGVEEFIRHLYCRIRFITDSLEDYKITG
jgi:hypothetical protein